MSDPMRPIGEALAPLFSQWQERAKAAQDLMARVRDALPAPEKEHVLSAAYKDDTLIITADSAAWSPRIRYAQQQLLEAMRATGETQFTKVKVRVGRQGSGSPIADS